MQREIKKRHIRIAEYVIQWSYEDDGFIVLDTTQDNAQVGDEYDHLCDAIEQVLKY